MAWSPANAGIIGFANPETTPTYFHHIPDGTDPIFKMALDLTPSDRQLCSQSTI
jgi:hypothetical protein